MLVTVRKWRLMLMAFVSLLIWTVLSEYFFCPSFSFPPSKPFSGNYFYNPYQSLNSQAWVKCNFHAHTNAWYGLTHGRGTARDVYRVYDSLQYSIHCVSDYQSIDETYAGKSGYIPAYEHGYNSGKTHQLVLGSHEVKWIDYLWPQTIHNKQNVLDNLAARDNVVIVNHPMSFHGYNASDFRFLSGYNCIEVLSPYAISTACWDTALSNGKPAFIVGDDDEHDIFTSSSVGKMCTFLNLTIVDEKSVLHALKNGQSYGVVIGKNDGELPKLNFLKIAGDSLILEMNRSADEISFVGQNGGVLQTTKYSSAAYYHIRTCDHYVRVVVKYPFGTSIYMNPVFRFDPANTAATNIHVDAATTNWKRISGLLLCVLWLRVAFPFVLARRARRIPLTKPVPAP